MLVIIKHLIYLAIFILKLLFICYRLILISGHRGGSSQPGSEKMSHKKQKEDSRGTSWIKFLVVVTTFNTELLGTSIIETLDVAYQGPYSAIDLICWSSVELIASRSNYD